MSVGLPRGIIDPIEVSFAGGASDHQGSQPHEPRPRPPHAFDRRGYCGAGAGEEVLIENEERLDRSNAALTIFDRKITVLPLLRDRVLDDLVIAPVLAFTRECPRPTRTIRELGARQNLDAPVRRAIGTMLLRNPPGHPARTPELAHNNIQLCDLANL